MAQIIQDIFKEIVNAYKLDRNIVSLTPVGSFVNLRKDLEKFNDIDIVIVFRKTSASDIRKLKKLGEYLKKKYSTSKIGVIYTLKIGPIKIFSKKPTTVMLQFLTYSQKDYVNASVLLKFSFQANKPLLGKPLRSLSEVKKLTKQNLYNEISGIPPLLYFVKNRVVYYAEPSEKGVKAILVKLSPKEYADALFQVILRLTNNILIYLENRSTPPKIDGEMCKKFATAVPIDLNQFPLKVLGLKAEMRRGKTFSAKEIDKLQAKSIEFINQCDNFLKTI